MIHFFKQLLVMVAIFMMAVVTAGVGLGVF
jgi:hypothetical protein